MKYKSLLSALLFVAAALNVSAYEIYPIPQQIQTSANVVNITSEVNLMMGEGVSDIARNRIKEVFERNGYTWVESSDFSNSLTNVVVGEYNSGDCADNFASAQNISNSVFSPAENRFDAHVIHISSVHSQGDILLLGDGNGSEFYAMATLEQILEQANGAVSELTVSDYAYTQYRGIVEGFYGHTYSIDTRLELMEFCKRYKLNTYVYGPKSDPYHLGLWREDYPLTVTDEQRHLGKITQSDITTIAQKAVASHVDFVWAIHPGLNNGISFSSTQSMDTGIGEIMRKFEHMYSLGVRAFGVFIDDMSYTPSGSMQAYLADQTQKLLREKYGEDIAPLFFVPTAYALNYSGSYTLRELNAIDAKIEIGFTGYDCFSNVRGSACADMASRVGRNPIMWWNNPVNDDHDDRIYMRKLTTHWEIEDSNPIPTLAGLLLNPMNQGNASKVALFGGADYAWNPAAFNADANWEAFFDTEFKDKAYSDALKVFASHVDALVEDAEFVELCNTFRNEYVSGMPAPDYGLALMQRMKTLYEACVLMESYANSSEKKYALMYEDVKCWLAKLKAMSEIIYKGLEYMLVGDETTWNNRAVVKDLYAGLHTNRDYFVSALEDAGEKTYERFYEVHPSKTTMEPFVDYLMPKIEAHSVSLPPRAVGIEVITNKAELPSQVVASQTEGKILLNGIEMLTLSKNEYVGLFFNTLMEASLDAFDAELPEGLEVQYAINGKAWTTYALPDDTDVKNEIAYVRIKNISDADLQIPVRSLALTAEAEAIIPTPVASTNMGTYKTYTIDLVTDGNASTFFWHSGPQTVGDYIILDYSAPIPCHKAKVVFTAKDQPTGIVAIEVSNDASSWEEKQTFTSEDLDGDHAYTCELGGGTYRYVRLSLKTVGALYWMQVAEFSVESATTIGLCHNEKDDVVQALYDRNLATEYQATRAGHVVYTVTENIFPETLHIYQSTTFADATSAPLVEVLVDEEWKELGRIELEKTSFDVSGLTNISQIKISWGDENIPSLAEIYLVGKPYVERVDSESTAISGHSQTTDLKVYRFAEKVVVKSGKEISKVTLWSLSGAALATKETSGFEAHLSLPMQTNLHYLLTIEFADGAKETVKL